MGRSFVSVRMEAKRIAERWHRAGRALSPVERDAAVRLSRMAKRHISEGFYAFDDPLEAALFSVLVELLKEAEEGHVDP